MIGDAVEIASMVNPYFSEAQAIFTLEDGSILTESDLNPLLFAVYHGAFNSFKYCIEKCLEFSRVWLGSPVSIQAHGQVYRFSSLFLALLLNSKDNQILSLALK